MSDSEEEIIKKSSESTFLPSMEKVTYHSIILLELFTFDDFDDLIKGLNNLYGDPSNLKKLDHVSCTQIENVKKELENKSGFTFLTQTLPMIINSKFNENSSHVSLNLGASINCLTVGLHFFSPSFVIMQINVKLKNDPTEELNDIIESDSNLKVNGVFNLRSNLKKEIINCLSNYFNGFFFKLSENNHSIVPSIDLYSLIYPENDEELNKLVTENQQFFSYFQILNFLDFSYKQDFCIISREIDFGSVINYNNYVMFANKNSYPEFDNHILFFKGNTLNFCVFAIDRLIGIYENIIGDLNATISEEIKDLEKNKLNKVIKNRKKISERIYHFKRFKTEFSKNNFIYSDFQNIKDKENMLFESFIKAISKKINYIDNAVDTLNQNANLILNLKNIEYSKNNQKWTMRLSVIVLLLALIQVIFAYFSFLQ